MENKIQQKQRANDLDGKTWTKYSISVWKDIRKNSEEQKYDHPAMFPEMLISRLIDCFTTKDDKIVLDPFMGSGAALIAAVKKNKIGIGFEISDYYIKLAKTRLSQLDLFSSGKWQIYKMDARKLENVLEPNSISFCVTSPPYWNILSQKRTADYKAIRDYVEKKDNLGCISDYEEFLNELAKVFKKVFNVLIPGKYCVVNVMDIRKKDKFYPFHSDLANKLVKDGFIFDDIIIWDRQHEYSNLRPLGYPYVFRINKVHEYLLIFKKPSQR